MSDHHLRQNGGGQSDDTCIGQLSVLTHIVYPSSRYLAFQSDKMELKHWIKATWFAFIQILRHSHTTAFFLISTNFVLALFCQYSSHPSLLPRIYTRTSQ